MIGSLFARGWKGSESGALFVRGWRDEAVVIATQIAVGGWYDRDEEDRPIRRDDDLEVIGLLVAFLNSV